RGIRTFQQPQRLVAVAEVVVFRGGHAIGVLHPSLNTYPAAPNDPIGTPSIAYGALHALYSSLLGFTRSGEQATLRFFLNPGVMWLWVGGGIVAFGGLLAAWPSRRRSLIADAPGRVRELAGAALRPGGSSYSQVVSSQPEDAPG